MEIILLKNMDNLGYKHDVVTVKNGYGRNYLIPQGLGVIANPTNMKKLDKILADIEAKEEARKDDYKEMVEKLSDKKLKIGVKVGSSGKIFGSVTDLQIAQQLKEQEGVEVDRRKIEMPDNIDGVGSYTATLNFHKDVTGKIDFELVGE